jgi:serine/threonine-protein kinase
VPRVEATARPFRAHTGQSADPVIALPAFIGPYRILRLIGVGGAGRVYLGRGPDGQRVAVKVAADLNGGLHREGCAAAAVEHPAVARVVFSSPDGSYLAMEHIVGLTFEQLVRTVGRLPPAMAASLGRQVAVALAHLHKAGWVHGDLKPANLMRTLNGQVKLIDFGAARRIGDRGPPLARWRTIQYLAPELARRPDLIDLRSDVYGLGAVLFYLLTGRPPGPAGTGPGLLLWALTADARRPPRLGRGVPDRLAAGVRRMLAADPDDRYPSALAVAEALTRWRVVGGCD